MTVRYDGDGDTIPCRFVCDRCGKEVPMTLTVTDRSVYPGIYKGATSDRFAIHVKFDMQYIAEQGWHTVLSPDFRRILLEQDDSISLTWMVCPECLAKYKEEAQEECEFFNTVMNAGDGE